MPTSPKGLKAKSEPEPKEGTETEGFYVRLPVKLAKLVRDTAHTRAAKDGRKVSYNEVIVQSVSRALNSGRPPAPNAS